MAPAALSDTLHCAKQSEHEILIVQQVIHRSEHWKHASARMSFQHQADHEEHHAAADLLTMRTRPHRNEQIHVGG